MVDGALRTRGGGRSSSKPLKGRYAGVDHIARVGKGPLRSWGCRKGLSSREGG